MSVVLHLQESEQLGLTVLRTWAFADGPQWNSIQPNLGQLDERVLSEVRVPKHMQTCNGSPPTQGDQEAMLACPLMLLLAYRLCITQRFPFRLTVRCEALTTDSSHPLL